LLSPFLSSATQWRPIFPPFNNRAVFAVADLQMRIERRSQLPGEPVSVFGSVRVP
jgi:hypothetical protein